MVRVSVAGYTFFFSSNKTKKHKKSNYQFLPQNNCCNNLLLNQVSVHTCQHPNMCMHTDTQTPIPSRSLSAPVFWSNTLQPSSVSSFLIYINLLPCFHDPYRIITGFCTFSLVSSSKTILSFPLHCRRRSQDFWQRKKTNFIAVNLIPLQDHLLFPPYLLVHDLAELAGLEQYVRLQICTEPCLPSSLPDHCMELIWLSQEEESASLHQGNTIRHSVLVGKSSLPFCGKISRTYKWSIHPHRYIRKLLFTPK